MISISQSGLITVSWVFTGIALVLTTGRFLIRYKIIGRYHWDDATHLLALLLLIAHSALLTYGISLDYRVARYINGSRSEKSSSSLYTRVTFTKYIVLWCCLWSVKVTFLLFYRLLFQSSKQFILAWWCVLGLVVATFWICIAAVLTACGTASNLFYFDKCFSDSKIQTKKINLQYSCAANVFSDIAIIALPLFMLKGLPLRTKTKLGLATIFCCALISIAFDLLRTIESVYKKDAPALKLYTNLEAAIAVSVSCLASYSGLFTARKIRKASKAASTSHNQLVGSRTSKTSGSAGTIKNSESNDYAFESQYFSRPPTPVSLDRSTTNFAMDNIVASKITQTEVVSGEV